jgi:hypothetical protein
LGSAIFGALLTNRFIPTIQAALPHEMLHSLPTAVLNRIQSPQALLNPETTALLQQALAKPGTPGQLAARQVLGAVRSALALSLQDIFVAGTIMMIAATLALFLLRDLPLRRSNRPAPRAIKS